MTPEDRERLKDWDERYSGGTHYEGCEEDHARCFYRRLIDTLEAENERIKRILSFRGYRETCDIAACNCGPSWRHGGFVDLRLGEISEELSDITDGTILEKVQSIRAENEMLREELQRRLNDKGGF